MQSDEEDREKRAMNQEDAKYPWMTPVKTAPIEHWQRGKYGETILTLGSCFSNHMGLHLQQLGYPVLVNPYGTLYNPLSIAQAIEFLLTPSIPHSPEELLEQDGLFHSPWHHSEFSASSKEDTWEKIRSAWNAAHNYLCTAQHVWITFGTTFVYESKAHPGQIVANCHKQPEKNFIRRRADLSECVHAMQQVLFSLRRINPSVHFLFTVSPIRYIRDGLSESNLSKSTLRLLCEELKNQFHTPNLPHPAGANYFPAFEIMMDELRDYRFYAADMLHPSEQAIQYIADRLIAFWAVPEEEEGRRQMVELYKLARHRPFRAEKMEEHIQSIRIKADLLRKKYPNLVVPKGIERLYE